MSLLNYTSGNQYKLVEVAVRDASGWEKASGTLVVYYWQHGLGLGEIKDLVIAGRQIEDILFQPQSMLEKNKSAKFQIRKEIEADGAVELEVSYGGGHNYKIRVVK